MLAHARIAARVMRVRRYALRAELLMEAAEYAAAAVHFQLALKHQRKPDSALRVSLGRCLLHIGEAAAARQQYDLAVREDRSNTYALFCRGLLLDKLGEERCARDDFENVVQLDSDFHVPFIAFAESAARSNVKLARAIYVELLKLPLKEAARRDCEVRSDSLCPGPL